MDDLAHVDLYSCFPSAVQIAAAELGLSLDRPLTVTGGLSFAGGPWNNYVMHSIATMVRTAARGRRVASGSSRANGGFVTKHAFGVYSTSTSGRRPVPVELTAGRGRCDAARELAEDWDGPVTVETGTVMHSREGEPENGLLALLLADGRRAWGTTQDPDALKLMVTEELVGRPAHLSADGSVAFV